MHGFVGGTLFVQDANLGPSEGGQALYVNNQGATTKAPNQDRLVFSGDVRQSRFNFSLAGPKVFGGATPKGVLEIDFFNGFGAGNYGDVSILPRMRLGYAELNWGANRLQFGQNNDLIFALAPVSLAHIAFPVGYGTGNIGWRRPALWGYHTFGDLANKDAFKVEFAWEVGRSQWADSPNPAGAAAGANGAGNATIGAGGDKFGFGLGEASGVPAVEARLTLLAGQTLTVFVGGHWQSADRTGVDAGPVVNAAGNNTSDIQTIAGVAGFKLGAGPLTVAASGFVGKNVAPLIGSFLQFQANTIGDVHEMGGWGQLGFNFTKELSLWGFAGVDMPNRADALAAGFTRLQNVTTAGLLQYRDGGFAVGAEWFHFHTTTVAPAGFGDGALDGNQFMLTGLYFF